MITNVCFSLNMLVVDIYWLFRTHCLWHFVVMWMFVLFCLFYVCL